MAGCLNSNTFAKKDPNGKKEYKYDLDGVLATGETLDDTPGEYSFFSEPPGLEFSGEVFAGDKRSVTTWVASGQLYQDYHGTFRFKTSTGREDDISIWFRTLNT